MRKFAIVDRLIAAQDIAESAPVVQFQHSLLCQIALPRSKVEARQWERHYGKVGVVSVRAGTLWNGRKHVEQPVPYGVMPRLLFAHLNTEAIRHQSRVIDLEGSMARFMERIGVRHSGSDFYAFKNQMKAIAAADFFMGYTTEDGRVGSMWQKPVARFEAWLTTQDGQGVLWPAELELSQDYYTDLANHAVPLDARALVALKHSALAIDAYCFLARRLHMLMRPTRVAFKQFHEQFGQEFKESRVFARKWKTALAAAKFVYPMAKFTPVKGGVILEPSPPPVKGQTPKAIE